MGAAPRAMYNSPFPSMMMPSLPSLRIGGTRNSRQSSCAMGCEISGEHAAPITIMHQRRYTTFPPRSRIPISGRGYAYGGRRLFDGCLTGALGNSDRLVRIPGKSVCRQLPRGGAKSTRGPKNSPGSSTNFFGACMHLLSTVNECWDEHCKDLGRTQWRRL